MTGDVAIFSGVGANASQGGDDILIGGNYSINWMLGDADSMIRWRAAATEATIFWLGATAARTTCLEIRDKRAPILTTGKMIH
jgi:hypothetical protein